MAYKSLIEVSSFLRSLKSKEKRIHRQLYLAMIIQIVIRLIINTDQYITRIGTIIEGSDSESSSNNTEADDTSSTNSSYNGDEGQNIIKGIDNTVRLLSSWIKMYIKTF